jgi:hypothetical protein
VSDISIIGEDKAPKIICPKCKKEQFIDLSIFKQDITKIMRDNCTGCGQELFVAVLILTHSKHYSLIQVIKTIVETIKPLLIKNES